MGSEVLFQVLSYYYRNFFGVLKCYNPCALYYMIILLPSFLVKTRFQMKGEKRQKKAKQTLRESER